MIGGLKDVGSGLVDGDGTRSGRGVGLLPGMPGKGRELLLLCFCHLHSPGNSCGKRKARSLGSTAGLRETWCGNFQPFGQSPEPPASVRRLQQRGLLARRKAMFHSIRPTRIRWQVAPALGLFLARNREGPDPTVRLADQQRGWHYGYLRKSVI